MSQPVQESLAVLKKAQREINKILSDPIHVHNVLTLNSLFERITSRLTFMGAVVEPDLKTVINPQFPPITDFMGEKIVLQPKIVAADLNPKEYERQLFRNKVQKLYDEFRAMGANAILKTYTIPEDVLLVRGVAKWAGVIGYEVKDMTVPFMEEIAAGITAREDITNKQKEIDLLIANEKKQTELLGGLSEVAMVPAADMSAEVETVGKLKTIKAKGSM